MQILVHWTCLSKYYVLRKWFTIHLMNTLLLLSYHQLLELVPPSHCLTVYRREGRLFNSEEVVSLSLYMGGREIFSIVAMSMK